MPDYVSPEIIGSCPALLNALKEADLFARAHMAILITGGNGTGKELLANRVHTTSLRAGRLVQVNCGAIPESLAESMFFGHVKGAYTGAINASAGLFKEADTGTLFLDEVGELSQTMQVKLLRVLETHEFMAVGSNRVEKVDIRIIAATNRDLWAMVQAGTFREDLYWRIHGTEIHLPALRNRGRDVVTLAKHFIGASCKKNARGLLNILAPATIDALMQHEWTGNIRELRNVIDRACLLAGEGIAIQVCHLPKCFEMADVWVNAPTEVLSTGDIPVELGFERDPPPWNAELTPTAIVAIPEPFLRLESIDTIVVESDFVSDLDVQDSETTVTEDFDEESTSQIEVRPFIPPTLIEHHVSSDTDAHTAPEERHYFVGVPIFVRPGQYIQAWRGIVVQHRTLRVKGSIEDIENDLAIVAPYQPGKDPYLWRLTDVIYAGDADIQSAVKMDEKSVTAWKDAILRSRANTLNTVKMDVVLDMTALKGS